MIPSIPAATLSDKVTIAAGKPETKGVAGGVQLLNLHEHLKY